MSARGRQSLNSVAMLNSDELGEKGQARFKEICADAKLICNQSDRDRTGWDFIVEFPFETPMGLPAPLEARKTPLSCHVQVKTLLEKNDRFQLRLSSAERLAKELKPAFIYVFKMNNRLEFTGSFLIHVLDEPLGKVLRRLRKEDAARNPAPNKKSISLSAKSDGQPIQPTGDALRNALISACGPDLHAYARRKADQLEKLGFEERPYQLRMTVRATLDDMVDVFLGLKKEVQASNLHSDQTRFDIKLPLPGLSGSDGKISIQPSPAGSCKIVVRSGPLSPAATFTGKVFMPAIPGLPLEHLKVRIDTDLFSMIVTHNGMTIETHQNIPSQTPATWASYWQLVLSMSIGKSTVEITPDFLPTSSTLEVGPTGGPVDLDAARNMLALCQQLSEVLRFSGVPDDSKFTMETMFANANQIGSAYALIHPEKGPAAFKQIT
jgi:hypothetical protein